MISQLHLVWLREQLDLPVGGPYKVILHFLMISSPGVQGVIRTMVLKDRSNFLIKRHRHRSCCLLWVGETYKYLYGLVGQIAALGEGGKFSLGERF